MATNNKTTKTGKPEWLKVRLGGGAEYVSMKTDLKKYKLATVCEEAACPNRGECWSARSVTIMILGKNCTRNCRFCNVTAGVPEPVDQEEPERAAGMAAKLNLRHMVLTCVTRDDLVDGGAGQWMKVISAIRNRSPKTSIEALVSDFNGDHSAQDVVFSAKPDVLAHNLETVPRLYATARAKADYKRSIELLERAKKSGLITKSGIMVGLGENDGEIEQVLCDLANAGVDIVTVGQYLQPTPKHLAVERYVSPDLFVAYKRAGESMGIKLVISAPLVRSSYLAHTYVEKVFSGASHSSG